MERKRSANFNRSTERAKINMHVDAERFPEVLIAAGVPEEEVGKYSLKIDTIDRLQESGNLTGMNKFSLGGYNNDLKMISINLTEIKRFYIENYKNAYFITEGDTFPVTNPFEVVVKTKRLTSYLQHAPKERALKFSAKLLERATQRQIRNVLGHEASHAADSEKGQDLKLKAEALVHRLKHINIRPAISAGYGIVIGSEISIFTHNQIIGMLTTIGVFSLYKRLITLSPNSKLMRDFSIYSNSPAEKRARAMGDKLSRDEITKDIVTFNVSGIK